METNNALGRQANEANTRVSAVASSSFLPIAALDVTAAEDC